MWQCSFNWYCADSSTAGMLNTWPWGQNDLAPLDALENVKITKDSINFNISLCFLSVLEPSYKQKYQQPINSSVLASPQDSIEEVGESRMLTMLMFIMDNTSYPLHETVDALSRSFSSRLLQTLCRNEHYRKSFIPTAVRVYNVDTGKTPSKNTCV